MRARADILAALLSLTVLAAAVVPCPPESLPEAGSRAAGAQAHAAEGQSAEPAGPELARACPCNCEKKRTGASGGRLGFALARADETARAPTLFVPAVDSAPLEAAAPSLGSDPIPI